MQHLVILFLHVEIIKVSVTQTRVWEYVGTDTNGVWHGVRQYKVKNIVQIFQFHTRTQTRTHVVVVRESE